MKKNIHLIPGRLALQITSDYYGRRVFVAARFWRAYYTFVISRGFPR